MFKRIETESQCSRLGCPHSVFGALKVTNLGKQILLNA